MFGLFRLLIMLTLAFVAGMLFERSDARTTCRGSDGWGAYASCALGEML
ncbi:MAG: hypothetical protein AAF330_03870 [Pseudomonadota bacterium]